MKCPKCGSEMQTFFANIEHTEYQQICAWCGHIEKVKR